jgi:type IV pilus assembly protein PilC
MSRFTYIALDSRGDEKSGQLDAATTESAAAALKAKGLFPVELNLVGAATAAKAAEVAPVGSMRRDEGAAANGGPRRSVLPGPKMPARVLDREIRLPFVRSVTPKELAVFTRQLGTLLKAGMPLLRGLEVLGRQEKNRAFRKIVETLADEIRSGGTLSEAMARHPRVFDRLYVNMIRAGETGGVLDVVLDRLAKFQEKSLRLRGKVKAAMVYPLIVMTVAVLILAGLLVFVVPKFKQIFADLLKGAPLPPLTQVVLAASEAVRSHYLIVLGVLVGAWFAFRAFKKTPHGARLIDGWVVRAPIFGELILKSLVARFARTLGTLLSSGVPILQAITITRDTTGNARVAAALEVVHDRVKEGDPVARPLEGTRVFPGMVSSMIEVGEQTGQLPEMLNKVADIYDDEVDTAVAGLSSLIEPLLIVFLALVVGTIVIALFLPIIRIVQLLT